jgi:DNA invertase Pin-like site-specific DNA recombinase
MKVAIFARVSTADQNNERQVNDLRNICKQQNWTVAAEITETISGAKDNSQRAGVTELLQLAAAGHIKKVIITEVSRLGRRVSEVITLIEQLQSFSVSVYVGNIGMETILPDGKPNFMFKPILVTLAGFAEMERELLRERIVSGMKTARKQGKQIGRAKGTRENIGKVLEKYPQVVKQLEKGRSVRDAAAISGVSPATVQKVKKALAA